MEKTLKLPIGIEDFEEIRTEGFFYIDKTGFIRELLNDWGKVNLFTRPRRFGKSLNMKMLKYFLEYGCDESLFDGLEIAKDQELCEEYMGRFPVIFITLKGIDARDYETARAMLCSVIGTEAMRFQFLLDSERLTDREKIWYGQLVHIGNDSGRFFHMTDDVLMDSLHMLSLLLQKHFDRKVVLLIDEYDVPLDKAVHYGYYDEMISLIRGLFGQALKSNDSLYFAVLTGCLRIVKESVFTGLNNFKVMSVTNVRFEEYFGFSDTEVQEILHFYGFDDRYHEVKAWYDGYCFGNTNVYCPWDVINYVDLLRYELKAAPRPFWANTSGNDIIKRFLRKAAPRLRREMECLIEGGIVKKRLNQELTYKDLYQSADNIYSVLFMTGYLTRRGEADAEVYPLAIPNLEIRQIFVDQILEWFQKEARRDTPRLDAFCTAFEMGDVETVEKELGAYLKKTISIRDTNVRKSKKENFYHGILLGILSHREDWDIESNAESGDGYSDILIEMEETGTGIVIEVKYPDGGSLDTGCQKALEQIEGKGYQTRLLQDGMTRILKYGIACDRKRCRVMLLEEQILG